MILSFNSITFSPLPIWGNSYDLLECARIISGLRYSGIEVIAGRPHAWPYDLKAPEREKLRKELTSLGLEITAVCPLISPSHNPASLFADEYREAQAYMVQCVNLAADLGSPYVIYPAGWVVHGTSAEEAWKRSGETLYKAARQGEKSGVTLLIEAIRKISSNLLWTSKQAVKMMEKIAHPRVKLVMDTFHVWSENEDVEEVIRLYGRNLRHIHIEDISPSGLERKVPGQGVKDLTKVVSALKEAGYEGALSVEIWGLNPEELAAQSFHYLSQIVPGADR
jgi:protein FrlC